MLGGLTFGRAPVSFCSLGCLKLGLCGRAHELSFSRGAAFFSAPSRRLIRSLFEIALNSSSLGAVFSAAGGRVSFSFLRAASSADSLAGEGVIVVFGCGGGGGGGGGDTRGLCGCGGGGSFSSGFL
jgi:hypothetical protein